MASKSNLHALRALAAAGFAALAAVSACRSVAAGETPAVLVAPDETVHAELVAALGAALGAPPVALAADALTRTNVLVIDRARPQNPALTGRTLEGGVQRFELVRDDRGCVLVRPSDGWRMRLRTARCRPVTP